MVGSEGTSEIGTPLTADEELGAEGAPFVASST